MCVCVCGVSDLEQGSTREVYPEKLGNAKVVADRFVLDEAFSACAWDGRVGTEESVWNQSINEPRGMRHGA